jgi:transglutaminase-like putative cysteine protease
MRSQAVRAFLQSTDIIDWHHPAVRARADEIATGRSDGIEIARACYGWVRDEIRHTGDFGLSVVTCRASEVLAAGTGFCFAKSHLLAALLRANHIPAGLCYQRIVCNDSASGFCLHGLNAAFLPKLGWYRMDARGNKEGIDAQFTPPVERLIYTIRLSGEADLPKIWPDPLPTVIEILYKHRSSDAVLRNLPDIQLVALPPKN